MRRRQRSKVADAAATVVLLLALAAHAARPVAAQPPSQQQLDELSAQCPVSVRYEMSLGQGQAAAPQVPIFVASVTLQNNANVSAARHCRCSCIPAAGHTRVGACCIGDARVLVWQ